MIRVKVLIKPNSKHDEGVATENDGVLIVRVKASAIEGRANRAAVKLLAKHFGVTQSQVRLVRGQTTKTKVFEIMNGSS